VKVGDLVRFKNADYNARYGVGITMEKYHSSVDYGLVVFFRSERVNVRQEELELISESR
jgi:hypothetical protein|tara:strand:+ start:261 stop:437 length:177 start_codon:yes stop_codon:yes gene_type:complete